MARALVARLLLIGVLVQGCGSADKPAHQTGSTGGTGGDGGTGGSGAGGSGAGGSGGISGTGGTLATGGAGGGGGAGGSGATGGSGGARGVDAAPPDAASPPDAPLADATATRTGDGGFMGVVPDGQPWQRQCPEGTSRSDCCSLYCGCMSTNCPATLPQDCQAACESAKNWDLVCRTYQCFASKNPNFPQDHDSHCKHAIGQLGKCGNR